MFSKNVLQLTIYSSALLFCVALFLPMTSFPVVGEVSYYRMARYESWCLIIFALAAPALILGGREKWSILSQVGVWGVLLFPAFRRYFESANDTMLGQIGNEVTSAMVDFSSDLFLNLAEFNWGGIVFLLALLEFTISGIVYRVKY